MTFMKRLRILFPGCPLERALDEKLANTQKMRADLADMVETATKMTIAPNCDRRERMVPVPIDRRRVRAR